MEQLPQPGGTPGHQPDAVPADIPIAPAPEHGADESWDERVIRQGIEAAVAEGRPIDDRTARYIAGQLHDGQRSALYALASSGAIDERVFAELDHDRTQQEPLVSRWIACLTVYCASSAERGPVAGWVEQAEALDRAELLHHLSTNASGVLGDVARIEMPDADNATDEPDRFPWSDAAHWTAGQDIEEDHTTAARVGVSEEEFDALFAGEADDELGDVHELGWYGVVRWEDRAGGLLIRVDSDGRRRAWVADSSEALDARWAAVSSEYECYHEERDAYDLAIEERSDSLSGLNPRVWVASVADYTNGELHGQWFDATREPEELELATRFMLRGSRTPNAEEWGIFDYDEFYGAELGEYESFETVSRIARGIAEHGEAFGHWAAYVGSGSIEQIEQIERFGDHYRGEWDSFEAYVRDYLEGTEFYRFLDYIPEDMRGYVEVDVTQVAQDWGCDYFVVELANGRVGVFDMRG